MKILAEPFVSSAGDFEANSEIKKLVGMREYDFETLKREAYLGIIYKYRPFDEWTFKTVEESKLHFSAPSAFNDILDCQIPFATDPSPKDVADYFVKDGWNRTHIEELLSKLTVPLSDLLREHHGKPGFLDEYVRICCFSKRNDINLMWSYYADKHQGICLGFDVSKDLATFPAIPVEYVDSTELAPLNNFKDPYAMYRQLYTKSSDWMHEEEVRVWHEREGDKHLWSFNPDSLTHIIFGTRASEEHIDRMLELVDGRDVSLRRAIVDSTRFQMKIENLK